MQDVAIVGHIIILIVQTLVSSVSLAQALRKAQKDNASPNTSRCCCSIEKIDNACLARFTNYSYLVNCRTLDLANCIMISKFS